MSDWTAGYVADVGYTFGYYAELNPFHLNLPLVVSGFAPPQWETACELGFGQGISVNIHAAAGTTAWWGTDFNPEQAAFAQDLARRTGSGAQLFDASFEEFCQRGDLPDFDFIALHGIWSWISDTNRHVIVDFIRRRLKPGGVLYISYNTQPGWATLLPLRQLMNEHVQTQGAAGRPLVERIDAALDFVDKLFATNPAFAMANPGVVERMKKLRTHNRHYLAHEYFNKDWVPMPFAEMQQWLKPAKLSYATAAGLLQQVDAANMTAEQIAFLREVGDPGFRETVRDHLVNQQFRRDLWMRGARRLTPLQAVEALRAMRLVLLTPAQDVKMTLTSGVGEVPMHEGVYRPILDVLADGKVRTVGELEGAVAGRGVNQGRLTQALLVLASRQDVAFVQDEAVQRRVRAGSAALNDALTDRARGSSDVNHLASPVLGGGYAVPRFAQMFLRARSAGARSAEELAQACWRVIGGQGQRVLKEGKPLVTDEENLAELLNEARIFLDKRLPVLQRLGIAE